MSIRISAAELPQVANIVPAPSRQDVDRTFELPVALYGLTFGLYLGFLALMTVSFMNPTLAIPMAICVFFVVAFAVVPGMWASINPENTSRALSISELAERGVQTLTGRLTMGEATAQVLVLPVLIFAWGLIISVISAVIG